MCRKRAVERWGRIGSRWCGGIRLTKGLADLNWSECGSSCGGETNKRQQQSSAVSGQGSTSTTQAVRWNEKTAHGRSIPEYG